MTVKPNRLRVEASSFCQLRCPSCPTTSGAIHPGVGSGFLRAADFEKLLDDAPWLRTVELSNYGEIFLNPELPRILEIAFERGIPVQAGNGVNLNTVRDSMLEAVVKYKVRMMKCSIDGASQETYQRYRVRGNFDTVIENIKRINELKTLYKSPFPALQWQFILFRHNEHEVEAARALAASLGMKFVPKLSWDEDLPPPDPVIARRIFGVASRTEHLEEEGRDYTQHICHQLWSTPQINWDGRVLGCARNFWGDFGSNAFKDGFLKAINSPRMRHARRMLRGKAAPQDGIPCSTCDIYLSMQKTKKYLRFRDVGIAPLRHAVLRLATALGRGRRPQPTRQVTPLPATSSPSP